MQIDPGSPKSGCPVNHDELKWVSRQLSGECGWNDELTTLISREGLDHARSNFRFALLEHMSMRTDDKTI
jgi:hypothetical protein